jgi:hypothetical protein
MTQFYVVTDEDGNVYGPYASADEATDLCDSMFEDRILCEINIVDPGERS